jgi:hypothetical protein
MPLFVAKRTLPGITPDALMSAGARAKTCCAEMTQEGRRFGGCGVSSCPRRSRRIVISMRRRVEAVVEANERARLPFDEISEVVEMTPGCGDVGVTAVHSQNTCCVVVLLLYFWFVPPRLPSTRGIVIQAEHMLDGRGGGRGMSKSPLRAVKLCGSVPNGNAVPT